MWEDPIVEEVRKVREEHARRFNYDLKAIAADLKKRRRSGKRKLVTLPPKKPLPLPEVKVEK